MGICKFCKKSFESNVRGRPKKYCSRKCREQNDAKKYKPKKHNREERKVTLLNCVVCNKPFESRAGKLAKYCNIECKREFRRKTNIKRHKVIWEGNKKICKTCNTPKEVSEYQKKGKDSEGNAWYSSNCKTCISAIPRRKARPHNIKFICKNCGKHSKHYDKRYTTFCSRKCSYAYLTAHSIKKYCKECNKLLIGEMKSKTCCAECSAIIEQKREEARLLKEKELERERAIRAVKQAIRRAAKRQAFIKKQEARKKELSRNCCLCKAPFQAKRLNQFGCSRCTERLKLLRKITKDVSRGKRSFESIPEDLGKIEYITLDELIKRDKNVCHICKGKCNKKDFRRSKNGAFIALENYPSIDHVVALSNGGSHTWDNVKLAHFYCNSIKRDSIITEEQDQLKFYL